MTFDQDTIVNIINLVTAIVTVASIISAMTPNTKDDSIVASVKKVVDFIALNFNKKK